MNRPTWFKRAAFWVLVVILLIIIPKPGVMCATCIDTYESDTAAADARGLQCQTDAYTWQANSGQWTDAILQAKLDICGAELASNLLEAGARYVGCMGLGVFGIKM